jgi:ATP-dependent Clp protease adaptor protein ClpS
MTEAGLPEAQTPEAQTPEAQTPEAQTTEAEMTSPPAPPSIAPPATERATRTLEQLFPPATVVLHNDDVNSMDHVVRALLESVPELDLERAAEIMLAAHNHGEADVITCPLERAELYRERLQSHALTATIRRG